MNREEHIARHKELHESLNELIADYVLCQAKLPSQSTMMEFLTWSFKQTTNPKELEDEQGIYSK